MRQALPLLLLAASTAQAQELTPEVHARLFDPSKHVALQVPVVRVPMRGTGRACNPKCPYFQAYVNGHGPFTFLFDTGAAYTLVSSRVVEAARTPVIVDRTRRDVVHIDRLKIGGVTVSDLLAIEDDTFQADGIIGFPTLGNMNLLFDLPRRQLSVSRKRIPMRNSFSLPYQAPLNVPTVPVEIGSQTVPILLDTGDDAYGFEIRSSELGDAALEHQPSAGPTVTNGANKQETRVATLKNPVKLGPVEAVHANFAINDDLPVGDFGEIVLWQFRFQIEPGRHRIEFEPLFRGKQFSTGVRPAKR
jgi:hypothetical protein